MVAEKRSATQKCGETPEGRGLTATKKSSVSEMALEIQICIAQVSPTVSLSPHSLPLGSFCVSMCHRNTCKLSMSQGE